MKGKLILMNTFDEQFIKLLLSWIYLNKVWNICKSTSWKIILRSKFEILK